MTEGRIGIRRLLRRYVLWRVAFRWYLFVLLGIPAIEVLGAIVGGIVAGALSLDGRMIDRPVVLQAARTLARAGR